MKYLPQLPKTSIWKKIRVEKKYFAEILKGPVTLRKFGAKSKRLSTLTEKITRIAS
jgi:hypothetical protein